jgi:hypothetical protein
MEHPLWSKQNRGNASATLEWYHNRAIMEWGSSLRINLSTYEEQITNFRYFILKKAEGIKTTD